MDRQSQQDFRINRAEREAALAIDLADKAISKGSPKADALVKVADRKLAVWEHLIGRPGWPLAR